MGPQDGKQFIPAITKVNYRQTLTLEKEAS